MNGKKKISAKILALSSIILGILMLSSLIGFFLLIIGSQINGNIRKGVTSKSQANTMAIICGLFVFVALMMFIMGWGSPYGATIPIVGLIMMIIFGTPFVSAIVYLNEEKKNPSSREYPVLKKEDQLEELKRLLDKNLITAEEYESIREKVINSI